MSAWVQTSRVAMPVPATHELLPLELTLDGVLVVRDPAYESFVLT